MAVTIQLKKRCSKCKQEKFKTEFHKRADRPSGVMSHCKECEKDRRNSRKGVQSAYNKKSYQKNKTKVKQHSKIVGQAKMDKISQIKQTTPCADCGDTFPGRPEVMDFDHRDPSTKNFTMARARWKKWETIELEMAKCDIVCANCHRTRTVKQGIQSKAATSMHKKRAGKL